MAKEVKKKRPGKVAKTEDGAVVVARVRVGEVVDSGGRDFDPRLIDQVLVELQLRGAGLLYRHHLGSQQIGTQEVVAWVFTLRPGGCD